LVIVVHPDVKANSVADLIKLVKATREPFQYGSPGVGSLGHLAGELFAHMLGAKMAHIPYKGTGPMMTDLLGGHISMSFTNVPASHANASVGKLRALAVASGKRSSMMPDVPTATESGLPGYEAEVLYGLVAPPKTPKPIVDRLNKELRAALATDVVRKLLATEGIEALSSTPDEYGADINREEAAWGKLIRTIGIQPEK
jgi:tripartite-type tricarboxylate transporter receptor subunit TctC